MDTAVMNNRKVIELNPETAAIDRTFNQLGKLTLTGFEPKFGLSQAACNQLDRLLLPCLQPRGFKQELLVREPSKAIVQTRHVGMLQKILAVTAIVGLDKAIRPDRKDTQRDIAID